MDYKFKYTNYFSNFYNTFSFFLVESYNQEFMRDKESACIPTLIANNLFFQILLQKIIC